ncbi:MAG: hypothetical protein ACRDYZ_01645 [Acidimicrobiales bacterium]
MGSTTVARPQQSTAPDPPAGTTLTATSSCPAGEVLVGGGKVVITGGSTGSASGSAPAPTTGVVALASSYPASGTTWRTVAVVERAVTGGRAMTLTPYVLCGKP